MDLSVLKKKTALALGGLLALTVGAGSMQATNYLSASATAASALTVTGVTCNTLTGPPNTGQNFVVHAFGAPAGYSIVVGFVAMPGLKVTAPAAVILNSTTNTAGITFNVNSTAGCTNATPGVANTLSGTSPNTFALQLTSNLNAAGANNDVSVTVTDTITATASPLVAAPVTITCGYTNPNYVAGAPKTVSVTSQANQGTPFTVVPGTVAGGVLTPSANQPNWLIMGPLTPSGTAGTTAYNFTVRASANCGGSVGTFSYAIPLSDPPAPAVTVTVTLIVSSGLSPLTIVPVPAASTISMTYVLNSNVAQSTTVQVTSSSATPSAPTYYQTANLPIWLTANHPTGYIPSGATGANITFTTTSSANSMPPGNYSATVFLTVSTQADAPVVINLLVTNAPPKLSVTTPNPQPVFYQLGTTAAPITTITVASNDAPIPYTITFGGPLAPMLTAGEQATGIAYSFGSNINVTYSTALFQTSAPGTVISGTVTFTWGSARSVVVVTINLTVTSPAATLTSISPASLPNAAPGSAFYITLTGNGFAGGTDPTVATKVGIVSGGVVTPDSNFAVTFVNSSNLLLKITVPALGVGGVNGDANLPFLVGGVGGPVYLGIVNGSGTAPTGTATLTIGGSPIIYGVTSSSSFNEVSGGALPTLAPYDMISIFGANFCSSQTTFPAVGQVPAYTNGGCSNTTILPGTPTLASNWIFPFSLTPDQYITPAPPAAALWRYLTVNFYAVGSTTPIPAPLLFATNGQINTIIPGALSTGQNYNIVVSFGCATCNPSTVASSALYPVSIVATDPGIFTIGADGQGAAAALASSTWALIGASNPAGMRYLASDSDIVQIYMTGLGVPTATGVAYNAGTAGSCVIPLGATGYLTALNTSVTPNLSLTTIDGAVIQTSLFPSELPPCMASGAEPVVTIGGVTTPTLAYAGFTGDTIAGLYQINVPLPSTQNTFKPNYQPATPASSASIAGQFTNLTQPTQLPVFVTFNGQTSQAGVMLTVAPKLTMTVTGLSSASNPVTITGATATNPPVFTTAGFVPPTGTMVNISGFTSGWTGANGYQPVTYISATTFSVPVNATTFGASSGSPAFAVSDPVNGVTETLSNGQAMTATKIVGNNNFSHTGVSYAITSGVLPQGVTMSTTSNVATISGTPAQNAQGNYPVTITATDSSPIPITGTTSFTYSVPGGLYVALAGGVAPVISTFGTANDIVALTVVGGTPAYTFAMTSPVSSIPGISFNSGTLHTDGNTPAGTYTVTVTATDAAGLTGTYSVTFIVKLLVTFSPASPSAALSEATLGPAGTITTLTVSGGVGPYTYTVDSTSYAMYKSGGLAFASNVLQLGTDSTASAGYQPVVIDVVDTGTPASAAAANTVTGTAGAMFTYSLNLGT